MTKEGKMTAAQQYHWQALCTRDDLMPGSGVCALVGEEQVALFYLPGKSNRCTA